MSLTRSVETAAPAAFESFYQDSCARLTQQTYLLTGHRHRAARCVRRAFQLAWNQWDTVGTDPSPEGWVRAAAFELALSPWHPALLRRPDRGGGLGDRDRELLEALLQLPRAQRRALVLHDALGLSWQQTAAEVESSTPAAYGRVVRARLGIARLAPRLAGPDAREPGFGRRLGPLLRGAAVRGCPAQHTGALPPGRVRRRAGLRDRGVTAVAGLATAAVAGAVLTGLTVATPWHPPTPAFITYGHGRPAAVAALAPGALTAGPTAEIGRATGKAAGQAAGTAAGTAAAAGRGPVSADAEAYAQQAARAVEAVEELRTVPLALMLRTPPAHTVPTVGAGAVASPYLLGTATPRH